MSGLRRAGSAGAGVTCVPSQFPAPEKARRWQIVVLGACVVWQMVYMLALTHFIGDPARQMAAVGGLVLLFPAAVLTYLGVVGWWRWRGRAVALAAAVVWALVGAAVVRALG